MHFLKRRKEEKPDLSSMKERLVGLEEVMRDVLSHISTKGKKQGKEVVQTEPEVVKVEDEIGRKV